MRSRESLKIMLQMELQTITAKEQWSRMSTNGAWTAVNLSVDSTGAL